MKNQTLKAIGGTAFAILMLVTFVQMSVSARDGDQETSRNESASNDHKLVGSWNHQVTLRDCQTGTPFVSFPAMVTFNHGGTTQQTAPPEPGGTFLPGHGVWSHRHGRAYSSAFQFFSLNPDGSVARRTIVRGDITLSRDGDSYNSTDTSETFDANGNLLFRACSTTTATRFQ